MNREEAAAKIRASRFSDVADELVALLEPSIRIRAEARSEQEIELGASRFGGRPDVPADFVWPRFNGKPLGFLAQLRLADLVGFETDGRLPANGWLLFFYENEQGPWGFDPKDAEGARVLYLEAAALERIEPPDDLERDLNLHTASRLRFEQGWELPDAEFYEERLPFAPGDTEAWDAYWDLGGDFAADGPEHHLFGHPQPVQGEMRLGCQLASNGLYCGDESGYDDPRSAELESGAADWKLLFQIDTDDDGPGWMWGDCGRLYFWIRESDLQAAAFDRAWLILQCS